MAPPQRVHTGVRQPHTDPRATSVSNPDSANYDRHGPYYDSTLDSTSPNYIHRDGTVDTGKQVHDQSQQQVDQSIDDGGLWAQLMAIFTRNGQVRDQYNQNMNAQATQLAARVDTRPKPAFGAANYSSYEHSQLKSMVTRNA